MQTKLSGQHHQTYQSIFRHPISHNIEWRELLAMFNELGDVVEESNGKFKFTRNGQTITLHPQGKEVEIEEVMNIRHFLDSSADAPAEEPGEPKDLIVVIDHAGARIYRHGAQDKSPVHIEPIDPKGHDQQVHNSMGRSGKIEGPYRTKFYENVVSKLEGADRILMVGDGHGSSSEIEHLVELMKERHPDLVEKMIGEVQMDLSHMTEPEIHAKALEVFTRPLTTA
jgi:hypothetical protein